MISLKKIPWRIWLLAFVLVLSFMAIDPNPWAKGLQIKTIEPGAATDAGVASGQMLFTINGDKIESITQFNEKVASMQNTETDLTINTGKGDFDIKVVDKLGFGLNNNMTIVSSDDPESQIKVGDTVLAINGKEVSNITDFNNRINEMLPKKIYKIGTDKGEFAFLANSFPELKIGAAAKSNIKKGLDLEGGTRVLLKPVSTEEIKESDISDLIKILSNRLNVYGLSDLRIREAKDWQGQRFVLIEISGASKDEVRDLIVKQGKFEAKIGNETVFQGGKKDIPFVCRNDGTCSGIRACSPSSGGYFCRFEFVIHLSPEAAKHHADITRDMKVITSEDGNQVLEEKLDFYLDGKMVDSLNIGSDLKGSETTQIAISGPGTAQTRDGAIQAAMDNMDKLQTILITGSLPFDLEIVKLDTISPILGKSFISNSIMVCLIALLGVALVIYIRYRSLKILIPMMLTSLSEVVIILGFAALINWNLDVAAIAGIIAAIGTGVDSQIVIIDENIKGRKEESRGWAHTMKNAFFIIFASYATTTAAMLPLWNAGAGLFRGFAITTIAGITIGVFLTRPAFAAIAEMLFKNKD